MFSIDVDDLGRCSFAIPAPDGEIGSYTFRLVHAAELAGAVWGIELLRLDPPKGREGGPYLVREVRPNAFECPCEDAKYRGYRKRGEPFCKHCGAAKALKAMLRALAAPLAAPAVPAKLQAPKPVAPVALARYTIPPLDDL